MSTAMQVMRKSALTDLLTRPSSDDDERRREWLGQFRGLLLPVMIAVSLVAIWSATAPLAGAVVAPAELKVEYKRKTVAHQEGGIVREILVRDGQTVRVGDPLLVVADVRQESDLNLLQDQWRAARARVARADAESRFLPHVDLAEDLQRDGSTAPHLERERALFAARRQALDEQTALLTVQIQHAQAQAAALESQIDAINASGKLSDEEIAINEKLASQGFVSRTRLIGLLRTSTD